MSTLVLSLLVAVVGLVMYLALVHPKRAEVGRLMFGAGLLAFLLHFANGAVLHLN